MTNRKHSHTVDPGCREFTLPPHTANADVVRANHNRRTTTRRARTATRRARKCGLTPPWCARGTAAYDDIADIYALAPIMSAAFKPSTPYEVDHIVALANGGEHRPDNLTWLPAATNASKGARTDWVPPPPKFLHVTYRRVRVSRGVWL